MSSQDIGTALFIFSPIIGYCLAILAAVTSGHSATPLLRRLPSLLVMAGGLAGTLVAIDALLDGGVTLVDGWSVTPYLRLTLRLDSLAAFFLLVISLPAIAAAWFGIGYGDAHHEGRHHGGGLPNRKGLDGALAAFVGAMTFVVLADGIASFLIAWEIMSLVSFFLVIGDGHRRDTRRAGYIYLVMTHIGTGFLLLAFLTLFRHAGSAEFASFRAAAATLPQWERHLVFLLALLGFGTKAGLIPLHVWLPRAHPAAPSHVSALMSGVMVKTAIYGLTRVIWDFAGPGPEWWGGLLLALGLISAVLGILYSLAERDLKRVLAYSTVEHIGIIVVGLGAASLLTSAGRHDAAALALIAALTHLLNHTLFKGLLFLGAGAIQTAAGTRDLEKLGGLIHRMPRTAVLMLVGSAAIAALPPLNGFVGEWLLFQSLLNVGALGDTVLLATAAAIGAGALALTGALALAGFVRAYGIAFLGQARGEAAAQAREVPPSMQLGMGLLAFGCVALGLLPVLIFRLLRPVTDDLVQATAQPAMGLNRLLDSDVSVGSYAPLLVAAGLLAVGLVPWLIARLGFGPGQSRVSAPWVCGFRLEPRMQYTASSFTQPLRLIFQALLQPRRTVEMERTRSPHVVESIRYDELVHPIYERYLYTRGVRLLMAVSHQVRLLQNGSIRAYLAYIFITLVVVLVLAR